MHAPHTHKINALEKYYILYARISHVYSLLSIDTLARTLKIFVVYLFEFQAVPWYDCKNIRTFPDGKLLTLRMPYINNVLYYLQKIFSDSKFILFVTFPTLIYLKE